MKEDKILVIIVTYNAMQWAERCFDSLRESTFKPDVYVVDNGSIDDTQSYIQNHYENVIFYQSSINLGFGKANNIGLQYALDHAYNYVYLLNQDAWVMPSTFERLIELSKQHPEYGILSPLQMEANMRHLDKNFCYNANMMCERIGFFEQVLTGRIPDICEVKSVMAAHWFMPIKCIREVGGFSPIFPHYGEDDNYMDRVHYKGLKVGIVPSLKVVHDRENRTLSSSKIIYMNYIRALRMFSIPTNHSQLYTWYSTIIRCLKDLIKYRSLTPLSYFYKILCSYSEIKKKKAICKMGDCPFLNI